MSIKRAEVRTLLRSAMDHSGDYNFSDAQSAARNALVKFIGLDGNASVRELMLHKDAMFAIIDEAIDEILPLRIQNRVSEFAEIQTIPRNGKAVFSVRTTAASRQRVAMGIQRGARGGIYKARRLDSADYTVETRVETVGWAITLEEILTGTRTLAELVTILAEAWEEKIYIEVFNSMSAAAAAAPAVNKVTGAAETIDKASLDKLIAIVRGYGAPTIMAFPSQAGLIPFNDGSAADKDDYRNQGYVGKYKGTPVILLPNYIARHGEDKIDWVFKEDKLFVIPAGVKPVKVVFQGDSFTKEIPQAHGGMEFHQHRMLGVGVVFNKNIASYALKDIWN